MNIEDDLRTIMHRRAAEVPDDAVGRVVAVRYEPRTARRLRRPALTALSGGAVLAGAAGVAIGVLGGASPAFAGWSPTPTSPSPGQLAKAVGSCRSRAPFGGLPLRLTDTRGPFTFMVYATDQTSDICITGPSFTSVSGWESSRPQTVPPGHLDLTTDHTAARGGAAYSFADGRAAGNVSAVTLKLDDGSRVQATVENGWFVAWWPSAHQVVSATLTTPGGSHIQKFRATDSPCGPKFCTSGGVGTSTGTATGPTLRGGTSTGTPNGPVLNTSTSAQH
jgi:hypothetical protein